MIPAEHVQKLHLKVYLLCYCPSNVHIVVRVRDSCRLYKLDTSAELLQKLHFFLGLIHICIVLVKFFITFWEM